MDHSGQHGEKMLSSDSLNPHEFSSNESFTAQLQDSDNFGSGDTYIQNFYPNNIGHAQQSLGQPAKGDFDSQAPPPEYFHPSQQVYNDFSLFGSHDPPQQNINPALFGRPDPSRHNINPVELLHSPPDRSSSPPIGVFTTQGDFQGSTSYASGLEYTSWDGVNFQDIRSQASDHSGVSSPALSPNFVNEEYSGNNSPLLLGHKSMQDFLQSGLEFDNFTLSESAQPSPGPSPRLAPVSDDYSGRNSPYPIPSEYGVIPPPPTFADLNQGSDEPTNMARAPDIQIEFAPPQRQPTMPTYGEDALLVPPKSPQRRGRSLSDPHAGRKSPQPMTRPSRTPSPSSNISSRGGSLTPSDIAAPVGSPSSPMNASKMNRRVSAPAAPDNARMLCLAKGIPNYSTSNSDTKRVQKHPATFQCSLCPKKFTRAYNLRSHLRTHTDERPFVCTVCGKAFARQHDRKRHEGLHSGEKKFVCKGQLSADGAWGCGRRFARADALGRHFRSEAGRICIRPLLDEENAQSQRQAEEHNQMQRLEALSHPNISAASGISPISQGQSMMARMGSAQIGGNLFVNGNLVLPAAVLAQYPMLADINWDAGPGGDGSGLDDEASGLSAFDVSGNEFEEDLSEGHSSHRNSFDDTEDRDWASDIEEKHQHSLWLPS